jgi:hypothetical protein
MHEPMTGDVFRLAERRSPRQPTSRPPNRRAASVSDTTPERCPGGYRLPLGPRATLGGVTIYRVRFEGPSALTLRVATALADASGVELISSDQPLNLANGKIALSVAVEGAFDAVADAVAKIRDDLPSDASIEITGT